MGCRPGVPLAKRSVCRGGPDTCRHGLDPPGALTDDASGATGTAISDVSNTAAYGIEI